MFVVAATATFAVATTFATAVTTTAATAAAFARHHLDKGCNFSVSSFARSHYATLEVKFLACERMVEVDNNYILFNFQNKALETVAVGIYEGDNGTFVNNIVLEASVEHEG
jgi:hypothetical protein